MTSYQFVRAEMWAAMVASSTTIVDEWSKPQQGRPRDAAAAARLKAGQAKGKTRNKTMRDALDKAKEAT